MDQILPSLSAMPTMVPTMAKPKAKRARARAARRPGFRKTQLSPFVAIATDESLSQDRDPAFGRFRQEAIRLLILKITLAYRKANAIMEDAVAELGVNWRTMHRWRYGDGKAALPVPGLDERIVEMDEEAIRDGWMDPRRHAAGNTAGEE